MPYPDDAVLFYTDRYYMLDNFSAFSVYIDGYCYTTIEHAYQAAKFLPHRPALADAVRAANSPHVAKNLAHSPGYLENVGFDWDARKVSVMQRLLRGKVSQHELVRKRLLETGDRLLVEDSPTDSFWGRGADYTGQNMLGVLWMNIRKQLQQGL